MIADVMIQTAQNAIAISKNSIIAPLIPQGSRYFNTTVLLVPSVRCPTRQKKAKASFLRLHGAGSREAILRSAGLWNRVSSCALPLPCKPTREQSMKSAYFAYLAFVGVLSFLMIFIVDRERKAGVERIAEYKIPHSALGGVDSKDSLLGANQIQGLFLGGSLWCCLLYTSPSPRDRQKSRMPSSA